MGCCIWDDSVITMMKSGVGPAALNHFAFSFAHLPSYGMRGVRSSETQMMSGVRTGSNGPWGGNRFPVQLLARESRRAVSSVQLSLSRSSRLRLFLLTPFLALFSSSLSRPEEPYQTWLGERKAPTATVQRPPQSLRRTLRLPLHHVLFCPSRPRPPRIGTSSK